jgi:hypothetical protein
VIYNDTMYIIISHPNSAEILKKSCASDSPSLSIFFDLEFIDQLGAIYIDKTTRKK